MEKEISAKKLQRGHQFEEALARFRERYVQALQQGDGFLAGLYMDEVVQTILLQRQGQIAGVFSLRDLITKTTDVMVGEPESEEYKEFQEDVEIAVRKRFPEKFGIEKTERGSGSRSDE